MKVERTADVHKGLKYDGRLVGYAPQSSEYEMVVWGSLLTTTEQIAGAEEALQQPAV